MGLLFALALLSATFSISQQQVCQSDNGEDETLCTENIMGWISNISRAGGSSTGGLSYELMWDKDPNLSLMSGDGYVVAYRKLETGSTRILKPINMNQGYTIMNLSPDTRYDAMVCLPETTPSSNFELLPRCGNCRLCFRTASIMTGRTTPTIVKSTVNQLPRDMGHIYICEAVASPPPNFTWSALNVSSGIWQQLENSIEGITITTQTMKEVKSQLTISPNTEFEQPICTADNGIGKVMQNVFMIVSLPTNSKTAPSIPTDIIIGTLVPIIIIVQVFIIMVCISCMKNRRKNNSRQHITLLNISTHKTNHVTETPYRKRCQSLLQKLPNSLIINPSKIEVSTIVGQGEFGVIYKGFLKSDMMETVAIKTLKGIFATESDIESLSKEIEKMQHFDHLNVMSLIGVCMAPSEQGGSSGGPCIVMPFMAKGSLLDQLRKISDELNVMTMDDKNFESVRKRLLQMCLQIAKGMEYLSGQKFVHRDLAARNCLVDAGGIIKVSDFGLAEDIYCQNYFRQVEGGTKLPLKWMAIESITQGTFTEKSDVWAYGITCWEVFTGGSMPYPGMHPRDVLDFLEGGERSARPKNAACDCEMFALMQSCWEHKSTSRPTFSDIVAYLIRNLEYVSDYLDLSGGNKRPPIIIANCYASMDNFEPST